MRTKKPQKPSAQKTLVRDIVMKNLMQTVLNPCVYILDSTHRAKSRNINQHSEQFQNTNPNT